MLRGHRHGPDQPVGRMPDHVAEGLDRQRAEGIGLVGGIEAKGRCHRRCLKVGPVQLGALRFDGLEDLRGLGRGQRACLQHLRQAAVKRDQVIRTGKGGVAGLKLVQHRGKGAARLLHLAGLHQSRP